MTAAAAFPGPEPRRPPFADASPAEVRAALIPEEAAEFDEQWREVTKKADPATMRRVLESWRRIAWMTAANGADAHRQMYRRAAARLVGEDIPSNEPLSRTKARLGL